MANITLPTTERERLTLVVLRMLSFICSTQSPYPPFFPITSVYQIYSCMHSLYYVSCCHFLNYVYNMIYLVSNLKRQLIFHTHLRMNT
jgi:hypothetical protein